MTVKKEKGKRGLTGQRNTIEEGKHQEGDGRANGITKHFLLVLFKT